MGVGVGVRLWLVCLGLVSEGDIGAVSTLNGDVLVCRDGAGHIQKKALHPLLVGILPLDPIIAVFPVVIFFEIAIRFQAIGLSARVVDLATLHIRATQSHVQ